MTINIWRLIAFLLIFALCFFLLHLGVFNSIIAACFLFWAFCQIVSL